MLQHGGPLEVRDEVVIAGGAAGAVPRHRAWPAVEVTGDGQLLVAYKESLDHNRSDDAAVMLAYSTDGGRTWPLHRAVAAEPGWGCITNHGLTRLAGGTLVLPILRERNVQPAHAGSGSRRECRTSFTRSTDGGTLWDASGPDVQFAELSPDYTFAYGRVQELAGGRLMAPFAGIPRDAGTRSLRSVGVGFSEDLGRTWSDFALLHEDRQGDICPSETDLIRLPDGRYLAMIRANRAKRLYRSYSDDEGRSWSPISATNLPGNCPALLWLASGALLCAYRDVTPGQYGVACAVSADLGETWTQLGRLYAGANADCAYPSMVHLSGGGIFCAFYTAAEPEYTGNCEIRGLFLHDRTAGSA